MDFAPSEQQRELCDRLERFARRELRPLLRRAPGDGAGAAGGQGGGAAFDELWERCARMGIFGLAVPERHGGSGHDPLTCALALEALGRGCEDNGFLFSVGVQLVAVAMPLCLFGSPEQRERFLGPVAEGRLIGAFCATESEAGSDLLALRASAAADPGGGMALEGTKAFVTNAPVADLFLVLAREAGEGPAVKRLSVFVVERGRPGLRVGPPLRKMGLEGSPMADLQLDGCVVPEERRLGPPGAGYTIFDAVMRWERTLLPAIYLGVMQAQLERACRHARQRRQFDRPLADFQAVSHALADMAARLEASRLLVQRAAWELARGRSAALESAMAKLVASESFRDNSQRAVQLHGAAGYMQELGLEGMLRDSVAATLYSGTSEVQRTLIARLLRCPDEA